MNRFDLNGKVAVVSGAAQGLGKATAIALAEHGADIVLVDRQVAAAEATAETVTGMGRRALVAETDVSDPTEIVRLFEIVARRRRTGLRLTSLCRFDASLADARCCSAD